MTHLSNLHTFHDPDWRQKKKSLNDDWTSLQVNSHTRTHWLNKNCLNTRHSSTVKKNALLHAFWIISVLHIQKKVWRRTIWATHLVKTAQRLFTWLQMGSCCHGCGEEKKRCLNSHAEWHLAHCIWGPHTLSRCTLDTRGRWMANVFSYIQSCCKLEQGAENESSTHFVTKYHISYR